MPHQVELLQQHCTPSYSTAFLPAYRAGRYGLLGALRCLMTSYFTNLVGALMLMGLMVGGGVFIGREAFVIE